MPDLTPDAVLRVIHDAKIESFIPYGWYEDDDLKGSVPTSGLARQLLDARKAIRELLAVPEHDRYGSPHLVVDYEDIEMARACLPDPDDA